MYHNLHGADSNTSAATNTQLLIDHVDAGLGVLGDGAMLTSLHTLAALNAYHGLSLTLLSGNDLDAGIIGVEFLIKCLGASLNALQASHAFRVFLNSQLLHRIFSFNIISQIHYTYFFENGNRYLQHLANNSSNGKFIGQRT
jgi:hypothetical protein